MPYPFRLGMYVATSGRPITANPYARVFRKAYNQFRAGYELIASADAERKEAA